MIKSKINNENKPTQLKTRIIIKLSGQAINKAVPSYLKQLKKLFTELILSSIGL